MAKNEAKIKFTAETGEFNKQIQSANNEMTELRAELRLNETQMKNTGTSVEGLEKKQKILTQQQNAAKSKVEALTDKHKKAVEIFGKNSTEASKLKTQLLNAQTAEEKIKQEVNRCNEELKEQKNASDKLEKSLDEVDDSARTAGDGFTVMKGAMSNLIADGVTGLVNGAKNAISSVANLEQETREYRAEMGKLDTAFTTNKHSTETAEAAYRELYSIIGETDQSVEAAQQISLLADSEEDVAKWAGYAAGVVGRFGDALQPETFYESANETLKLGEATGAYTQMLEGCGVNVEKFNEGLAACKTEGEKQAYMLATTDKLLGDASKSYKETNADVIAANKANADYTATMGAFGEKVAPVTTAAKEGFNGLLEAVYELVEDVDMSSFTSAISDAFATIKDTVLPAVVEAFGKLKEAWQWLSEHTGLLATVAAAIAAVTAGITAYNVVQAVKAAMDAANVTTVWALVSAHIAQAAAALAAVAPYIAIAAAIAAVIAVIVLCVKNWDKIKAKITEVAKKVKEKVTEIKNQITEKLNAAKQKAVQIFENIKKTISDKITTAKNKVVEVFNKIKNSISEKITTAKNKVVEIFNKIKTSITEKITALRSKVTEIFNSIKTKIMTPINTAKTKAVEAFNKIRTSVAEKITALRSKVTEIFNSIKTKIMTPINTAKSKVVSTIESLRSSFSSKITSIKNKVTSVFSSLKDKLTKPIEQARSTIKNTVDKIKKVFNFSWSLPKLKIPKISITGGKAPFGIGGMGSLPKFSITWNKEGAIFKKPTIFNTRAGLQGAGEAGAEAILPIDKLKDYIADTVEDKMNVVNLGALAASIERLADRPIDLNVNGRKFATATAGDSDRVNGLRSSFLSRDLVLD